VVDFHSNCTNRYTEGNHPIARNVTRKVRIKHQIIAHVPTLATTQLRISFEFFQQSNCAFSFLMASIKHRINRA